METQKDIDAISAGERRRKHFSRAEQGLWRPDARKKDPAKLLVLSVRGRLPALVKIKNERMAHSPFSYFRGAVPIMAYDLSLAGDSGIQSQLCGDAHVQNLGAYTSPDGRLLFDINDFDETIRGPFEWDVKRMATSLLLAGRDAGIKEGSCIDAAERFLESYCGLMHSFARMPVLAVARYQVHRLMNIAPVSKILREAVRATPMHSLEGLTEETKHGGGSEKSRVFKSEPPLLKRITGGKAATILHSLKPYRASLLPERRHFFAQFRPVDVAFKVVGTGSVGLRDYCVYLEGNGSGDPLFLQIKQEAPSAYAGYLTKATPHHQDGQRVTEGQRAMQLQSDPLLGWTTLAGRSYLVRQLNDHKASLDITGLKAAGLSEYASVCGELLARGHARSGDARLIAGYVGGSSRFQEAIVTFAKAYAAQTVTDWKVFVKAQKRGSPGPDLGTEQAPTHVRAINTGLR